MANLTTKTKYLNIVVRKKFPMGVSIKDYDNKIHDWLNDNCELYCYIYHMEDINLEGVKEDAHVHIVATAKEVKRLSTFLSSFNSFCGFTSLGVMIDKINSYEGSLQYLLHLNDKQKTQHVFEELIHNYNDDELKVLLDNQSDTLTAERLYQIVLHSKSNYEIMLAIGLHRYHNLRNVIRDIKEDIGVRNRGFTSSLNENNKKKKGIVPIV